MKNNDCAYPNFVHNNRSSILAQYKAGARRRNILFELNNEQFYALTQEDCFYCGCAPCDNAGWNNAYKSFVWNGVDRIDNNRGYVISNCVPCCGICNKMKGRLSYVSFIEHAKLTVLKTNHMKEIVKHLSTPIKGKLKKRISLIEI